MRYIYKAEAQRMHCIIRRYLVDTEYEYEYASINVVGNAFIATSSVLDIGYLITYWHLIELRFSSWLCSC